MTTLQHEALGALKWTGHDWLGAVDGVSVRIVDVEDGSRATVSASRFDAAATQLNVLRDRLSDHCSAIADAMLDLYNRTWSDEEHPVLDRGEFIGKLRLTHIVFYGSLTELMFDDGDMFGGHAIVLGLDETGAVQGKPSLFG